MESQRRCLAWEWLSGGNLSTQRTSPDIGTALLEKLWWYTNRFPKWATPGKSFWCSLLYPLDFCQHNTTDLTLLGLSADPTDGYGWLMPLTRKPRDQESEALKPWVWGWAENCLGEEAVSNEFLAHSGASWLQNLYITSQNDLSWKKLKITYSNLSAMRSH